MPGEFALEVDGKELVKQLDKVKTGQTRWFGFVKAGSPKDAYLELSKTEGQITRSMMKAKKGRTTVLVTGEVSFQDGAFSFDSVKKNATAGKAMRRQMKEGLSKHEDLTKHKQRLKDASVDGEVVDSEGADEETEETEETEESQESQESTEDTASPETDPRWAQVSGEAKDVHGKVKAKLGKDDADFLALEALRKKAIEEKRGGDLDRAIELMERLVVRGNKLVSGAPKATTADWKRLQKEAQSVYGDVKKAFGADSAELQTIDGLLDEAISAKKRDDLESAVDLLEELVREGKLFASASGGDDLQRQWDVLQGQAKDVYGQVQKKLGKDSDVFRSLDVLRTSAVGKKKAGDLAGAVQAMGELVATGLDGVADGPALDVRAAADIWQSAIDDVNGQLNGLAGSLRSSGNEALVKIADLGLNALVDGGGLKVPLMARIFEIKNTQGDKQAKSINDALDLSARFNTLINTDKRYEAVDHNPFGVKMTIRSTMTGALQKLDRSLRAAL